MIAPSDLSGDSVRHFFRVWRRIARGEPTALVRFGDGESALMRGESVAPFSQAGTTDGWSAPDGLSRLGRDLERSMARTEPAYLYGIPGRNDLAEQAPVLERLRATPTQLTFANLFCNVNYPAFRAALDALQEPVVIVASERGVGRAIPRPRVLEYLPMPHDCVRHWEHAHDAERTRAIALARRYDRTLFLVAAGPVAKVLIHEMFETNPTNRYLDVGSALDEVTMGCVTRPFMQRESEFARHISRF